MDIFRPDSSAQTTFKGVAKPAIMFLFGGGFMTGSRSESNVRGWFSRLTANGYTVVAMDYRLGMKGYRMAKGLGGALMPPLQGHLIDQQVIFGWPAVNFSFILPFICFICITIYGYRTYRLVAKS